MAEQWREIREFKGMYEVSSYGRIRSLRGENKKVIKTHLINSGYLKVAFSIKGVTHNRLVHRLVALEFCPGYQEGYQVNHKDADRTNNVSSNLEWVSCIDNIRDCIARGTHSVKEAHKVAHEKRKRPVAKLSENGEILDTFSSAREASKHAGVHENCLSRVCRGVRAKTAGYKWMYLDSR